MKLVREFVQELADQFQEDAQSFPWQIVAHIQESLTIRIQHLSSDFIIKGNIAIHKTAMIEEHVVLKGPLIVSQDCFIAAHAYLRQGVYLGERVSIGPGCELKSSYVFSHSALAHFNFIGDSLIGSRVNMEAGSVIANHFNERKSKEIEVIMGGDRINTGAVKFGALVGDDSRIGANAVLSPGTILSPGSIVGRLELIRQI